MDIGNSDRGPYATGRIIDLRAGPQLASSESGVASPGRVQCVGPPVSRQVDQRTLLASLRGPGLAPNVDDRVLVG